MVDAETAAAILEEAGKVTAGTIAPLNRPGDEEGCQWNAGAVSTPAGFPEAYRTYAEGGWVGVGGDPAYGGMGMPKVISAQVEELVNSANLSFGLYPMLTAGACLALNAHASDELKDKYLPNMYAGIWAGSICLTEPHAGTDLGIIRTRAEPQADGSYKISGTKIFITGGEHDLTENIIHLVLELLPGRPGRAEGHLAVPGTEGAGQRRRFAGREEQPGLRLHRAQDGDQGLGHLRDELRRRYRLAGGRGQQRAWRRCSP